MNFRIRKKGCFWQVDFKSGGNFYLLIFYEVSYLRFGEKQFPQIKKNRLLEFLPKS